MAKLSNINGKFAVEDTGAIRFSDQTGTTGQILKSNGNSAPTWVDPNTVGTGPWLPLAGGIVSGATTFQSSLTVGGVLTGTSAIFTNALNNTNSVNIINTGGTGTSYGLEIKAGTNATDHALQVLDKVGSNLMRVNGAGNVGIGIATPTLVAGKIVHIHGVAAGVHLTDTASGTASSDGGYVAFDNPNLYIQNKEAGSMFFETSGTTRLTIDSSGNVGIGNTSPTLSTLAVGIGSTNSPSQICQLAGSGSGVYSVLSLTNTNGTAADNNGVGLDFHVNAAYSATGRIQLIHPTAQSGTTTNSSMQFLTYGTVSGVTTFSPRMTINYNGNVGIGTTSPGSKLTVSGPSTAASNTASQAIVDIVGSSTAHLLMGTALASPYGAWINTDATGQPLVLQGPGGNVGIGTDLPGAPLHVFGTIRTTLPSDNSYYSLFENTGSLTLDTYGVNSGMQFKIAGSTKLTILNSGNVGIGTTSPNTKLDVSGPTGTRNKSTTGNSSVYETSLYFGVSGNSTANVSIDTSTVFPPMVSGGFILVEVSASGYGNSGSNGLIFSYITGGYGGHYAALNQPYHPVAIIVNSMQAGTCTWYNPNPTTIGITVTTTNSQGLTGLMRVKVTTTY